jgi:ATP-binding cassette subfamily B protein
LERVPSPANRWRHGHSPRQQGRQARGTKHRQSGARLPGGVPLPRPDRGAIFFLGVSSAATLAIPYGFKQVIDRGFAGGEISSGAVTEAFQYLLMIVVVLALATGFRFYFVSWLGERTVADLRRQVQRNLLTLPPRFFEENRPSEIASRLTADTAVLEQVVGSSVSFALRNLVTGVGGIVYLFALSPKLAGMLLVAIPYCSDPSSSSGARYGS